MHVRRALAPEAGLSAGFMHQSDGALKKTLADVAEPPEPDKSPDI